MYNGCMHNEEFTVCNDLTFVQATDRYLEKCQDWLGPEQQLLVTSLEKIAQRLDARISSTLIAEMVKIIRLIQKERPEGSDIDNELADFLAGINK